MAKSTAGNNPHYIHYAQLVQLSCLRCRVEVKPFLAGEHVSNQLKQEVMDTDFPSFTEILSLHFLFQIHFMLPLNVKNITTLKRCYKCYLSPNRTSYDEGHGYLCAFYVYASGKRGVQCEHYQV